MRRCLELVQKGKLSKQAFDKLLFETPNPEKLPETSKKNSEITFTRATKFTEEIK